VRSRDISHVNQPVSIIIINALHLHHHWPPSPPSPLPPHHHLHDVSKHGYDGRNTPATMLRHRDAPKDTNRPQRVENAPDATRDRAEGAREGRGGEHARDKGRGAYKVRLPFHFLKLHLLISPSPKQGPPPPNTKTRPVRVCFGVRRPLPPFRHVAAALMGVCYVSF